MTADIKEIRKKARERLKGYCRVCPVCDGRACAGEVPGMGGTGTGMAFKANLEALAEWQFRLRAVHEVKDPELSLDLWGQDLKLPLLAAPMTGVSYNMGGDMSEQEFISCITRGAVLAGSLAMTGDGADPAMYDSGIKALEENKGRGVAIIKPRSQEEIISRIRTAEKAGALAVGVDIDGAGLLTMALKGQAVSPKSRNELKELVDSTSLPFILKGVMTPEDALSAMQAGVSAIVVSNHGGRVLDCTPGVARVLPEIADLVKGRMLVMADGGVRSGGDVLKLLALGADLVLVGRPLVTGAFGGEDQGVALVMNKFRNEMIQAMLLTGTSSVACVQPDILQSF